MPKKRSRHRRQKVSDEEKESEERKRRVSRVALSYPTMPRSSVQSLAQIVAGPMSTTESFCALLAVQRFSFINRIKVEVVAVVVVVMLMMLNSPS